MFIALLIPVWTTLVASWAVGVASIQLHPGQDSGDRHGASQAYDDVFFVGSDALWEEHGLGRAGAQPAAAR